MTLPIYYNRKDLVSIIHKANKKHTPIEVLKKSDHIEYSGP